MQIGACLFYVNRCAIVFRDGKRQSFGVRRPVVVLCLRTGISRRLGDDCAVMAWPGSG